MTDSFEILKNMPSLDEGAYAETPDSSDVSVTKAMYQEVISPDIAKRILGSRFIDKPDTTWQLIFAQEETVLVAYRDGEEPVHFVLQSDDEIQTYNEMRNSVSNFTPATTEVVNAIQGQDSPWLTVLLISMLCIVMLSVFLTWFVLSR